MAGELWKPYPTGGCKPQELTICQALLQRCTALGVGGGRQLQVTLAPSMKHTHAYLFLVMMSQSVKQDFLKAQKYELTRYGHRILHYKPTVW